MPATPPKSDTSDTPSVSHHLPERLPAGERRAVPADQLTTLSDDFKAIIELMTYGLDEPGTIDGERFEAGQPLTLTQAARAVGVRLRRAREVAATDLFQHALSREVEALRRSERARNLKTLVKIRDDPGLGLAADRAVRIKAVQAIDGRPGAGAPTVNVQVNNGCDQRQVRAGYVIRLGPSAKGPEADT
ncbi:hypothetical protein M2322_000631 [Rhodoblastus acidophilus]|uniref:hypothetical protein n=1 Tax=Rhodoblastus acidophilus TaxID=1074 RepID=UPI00222414FC|nr:hypothetical protein [Rhodoblastus acidophilus]MCW2315111.1 hypothetical protein [Rhodoblastus acidophilus]